MENEDHDTTLGGVEMCKKGCCVQITIMGLDKSKRNLEYILAAVGAGSMAIEQAILDNEMGITRDGEVH